MLKMEVSEDGVDSIHQNLSNLGSLSFVRLLSEAPDRKMAVIEAKVKGSTEPAVVVLEKLPFSEDTASSMLAASTEAKQEFTNDIYGQYQVLPLPAINGIKANIVHPATEKHISKYLASPGHLVLETPDLYHGVTLPSLAKEQFSLQWVYNVLEHKKEVERIIFEDPDPTNGFILAPDFKWSGKQAADLYCLAIIHKRGVRSLRDLTAVHLPLLRNLNIECKRAVEEKWGLPGSKVRCYLHYQPSYYHLHIHVTALDFNPPGVNCEKSHLLDIVIANIEQDPNFYQKATLAFVTREKEMLYKAYKEHGYFEPNTSKQDFPPCLRMWESLGKAKHEPCGEFWETTYGESAWRLAIMVLCLPERLDRQRLVSLALASSLASIGACNDENTEWEQKVAEVTQEVAGMLPAAKAGVLAARFREHAEVRRGMLDGSPEHSAYRGVLELEETMLRWEEEVKDGTSKVTQVEPLLAKMSRVRFPGWEDLALRADPLPLKRLLAFWLHISKLQKLQRTGWVRCGVREPETVASHMYRMAMMGLLVEGPEAAMISLSHDMAECVIGDITPHCKVSPEEKALRELTAFKDLVKGLPGFVVGDLLGSFKRYEDQKEGDEVAKLVKDLDKFDMIVQAWEYEKRDKKGAYLQQFFDSTKTSFKTPLVKMWQEHLLEHREKHFAEA